MLTNKNIDINMDMNIYLGMNTNMHVDMDKNTNMHIDTNIAIRFGVVIYASKNMIIDINIKINKNKCIGVNTGTCTPTYT